MAPAQVSVVVEEQKKPEVAVKSEPKEGNWDLKANGVVEDVEVDILEVGNGGVAALAQGDDPDVTEHSSSFGNTFSGPGDASNSSSSDAEVESGFCGKNPLLNGSRRVYRKKKLADHWRNFIRPLMWRCQWIELRMNELQSQARKYDNELAKYVQGKQLLTTAVELDSSASRTVPLTYEGRRKQAMKRRKRKRTEDAIDISSYMSHHNIFSYYENKRSEIDCRSVNDDCGDSVDEKYRSADVFEALNEWLMAGESDASLEQIMLNIEAVQSRVMKLKTRLDAVMKTNAQEISLSHEILGPGDQPYSLALSPSCSPRNNGDTLLRGVLHTPVHHISEYETDDPVLPGSTVSSFGDAAEPDIVESTLDLLSAAPDQRRFGDLCKDNADEVLISNQAAEQELQNFGKVVNHELVKEDAESSSFEEEITTPKLSVANRSSDKEKADEPQPSVPKTCYSGKKRGRKPKRKRRGGYSGNYKSERLQKRRLTGS